MTQLKLNFHRPTKTLTMPAFLAVALITGETSGLDDLGESVLRRLRRYLGDLEVVDVVRDENGEAQEPWFTWSYGLYGGECAGGECLDYVCQ